MASGLVSPTLLFVAIHLPGVNDSSHMYRDQIVVEELLTL